MSKVAEEVGYSSKTVRRRLSRLIDEGLIEFSSEWFPSASNDIMTTIHVEAGPASPEEVLERLMARAPLILHILGGYINLSLAYILSVVMALGVTAGGFKVDPGRAREALRIHLLNLVIALLAFSLESPLGPPLWVVDELGDEVLEGLLDRPNPVDAPLRGVQHGAGAYLVAHAVGERQPLPSEDVHDLLGVPVVHVAHP